MRELRFSVDDLTMALRSQGIFDLSEVQFAVVETTGSVSVMKKSGKDNPTKEDMGIAVTECDPPHVIISDGIILNAALNNTGITEAELNRLLRLHSIDSRDIFIMTADREKNCFCSMKDGKNLAFKGE